ncbi:DUF3987 domain-containing protein [uncultured Desulfovibrio sp.]|uniref:DUF3987 domain-containing protein n=1 Tax=uncultured Desulfovibrio sp. TaxID=167968 RepID=UPI002613830B|nr:DUF3987 domain-containing protein [uncultured Desulfovibrio sp.]
MSSFIDFLPNREGFKFKSGQEWAGPCPWCGGEDRFVVITDGGQDGKGRFFCRQCGERGFATDLLQKIHKMTPQEARDALGITFTGHPGASSKEKPAVLMPVPDDAPRPQFRHPKHGAPSATWAYHDTAGRLLGYVCRFNRGETDQHGKARKEFCPYVFTGNGWRWQGFPEPRPLYGLQKLAGNATPSLILLVEGEGKADALQSVLGPSVAILGLYGGCKAVWKQDFTSLAGRQFIYWPDADAPGAGAALSVAEAAGRAEAAGVRIVAPPTGVQETWDAADAVKEGWDSERLAALIGTAVPPADFAKMAADRWDVGGQEAVQEEWPEPVAFAGHDVPVLNLEALPSVLGDFCRELAEEKQVPPELVLSNALAVLATAAQARYVVRVRDGFTEPLNLYTTSPLDPANRKSAVVEACTAPLREWEAWISEKMAPAVREAQSQRQTLEKFIEKKRGLAASKKTLAEVQEAQREILELEDQLPEIPVIPRLLADNCTPEALAVLMAQTGGCISIITAEGGLFDVLAGMYSKGVANLDLFLKAYSGDGFRVDRRNSLPVILDYPHLTLGICPQPITIAERSAARIFRGRGLDGRFIYFMPESLLGKRKIEPAPMSPGTRARFHDKVRSLLPTTWGSDMPGPTTLELSDDAYQLWKKFALEVEKGLAPGGEFEGMTDWGGKLAGTVARIAALFHLVSHDRPEALKITLETMQRATCLGGFLAKHAQAAYGLMSSDDKTCGARRVLEWIQRKSLEAFTVRECWQAMKQQTAFPHVEAVHNALAELEDRDFIRELPAQEKRGPGRKPSPTYAVNPRALKG